jgi:hypothetical protein
MLNITQLEILVYTLLGIAVFGIAYMLKKYRELSDQFIEEKLMFLNYTIPVVERMIPILPDKYQDEAKLILDIMKEMKTINEAIKNMPATARFKAWKSYKKTLEMKLKLKLKLIEG